MMRLINVHIFTPNEDCIVAILDDILLMILLFYYNWLYRIYITQIYKIGHIYVRN